jgi:hypothetical protein
MKIATLKGCKQCAKLKSELKGLIYQEVDCDSNPGFCDSLEVETNTFKYPMVVNGTDLYYVAESYEDLKLINTKKGDYILKPQASLEQMIEKLKQ